MKFEAGVSYSVAGVVFQECIEVIIFTSGRFPLLITHALRMLHNLVLMVRAQGIRCSGHALLYAYTIHRLLTMISSIELTCGLRIRVLITTLYTS